MYSQSATDFTLLSDICLWACRGYAHFCRTIGVGSGTLLLYLALNGTPASDYQSTVLIVICYAGVLTKVGPPKMPPPPAAPQHMAPPGQPPRPYHIVSRHNSISVPVAGRNLTTRMLFNLRYTLGLLQTTASWGHESRPGGAAAQHMRLQNLRTSGQCLQGSFYNHLFFATRSSNHGMS